MKRNKIAFSVGLICSILLSIVTVFSSYESDTYQRIKDRVRGTRENLRTMDWKEFLRRNGWAHPWLCLPCLPCVYYAMKGQEREIESIYCLWESDQNEQ